MKKDILVHVNGEAYRIEGQDAFLTLSDFLRTKLRLVGTKIMCSEGDCGACTVLVGRPHRRFDDSNDKSAVQWNYLSVDSCIQFMFQLEAAHVVTIEGLCKSTSLPQELTPIQNAFVDHQGSQCGYCTPGFVMSLAGMREQASAFDTEAIREGLSGNLCRCTGYVAIEEAATDNRFATQKKIEELFCHTQIYERIADRLSESIRIESDAIDGKRQVLAPLELDEAIEYLQQNPKSTIIAGASDVGVWHCKFGFVPQNVLCINRIEALKEVYPPGVYFEDVEHGQSIILGAALHWESIREVFKPHIPQFERLLSLFGSPQIRHVGTIGGNIINGSPIADSLPVLFALDASLRLVSQHGLRWVPIHEFYTGYKKTVMQPGEMLTHIELPIPKPDEVLKLYKVSRRRDMDISTFTAAIALQIENGVVNSARIALGGVGPQVIRATKTEQFIVGKEWCEQLAVEAGEIATTEVTPISDVRGSEKYRRTLTKNIFHRFYFESCTSNSPAQTSV